MKTTTTKHNNSNLGANQLETLENDPVWTILDEAPSSDASPSAKPMFARNVMREIRLLEDAKQPWWKAALTSKFSKILLPTAAVTGAAAAFIVTFSAQPSSDLAQISDTSAEIFTLEDIEEISDSYASIELDDFAQELLAIENEDPIFMSAEEIHDLVSG